MPARTSIPIKNTKPHKMGARDGKHSKSAPASFIFRTHLAGATLGCARHRPATYLEQKMLQSKCLQLLQAGGIAVSLTADISDCCRSSVAEQLLFRSQAVWTFSQRFSCMLRQSMVAELPHRAPAHELNSISAVKRAENGVYLISSRALSPRQPVGSWPGRCNKSQNSKLQAHLCP